MSKLGLPLIAANEPIFSTGTSSSPLHAATNLEWVVVCAGLRPMVCLEVMVMACGGYLCVDMLCGAFGSHGVAVMVMRVAVRDGGGGKLR
ncbi:Hypothetical predicted protein [Olea europaea subsp. europaea]|uniref:Uncharacterized protein n=1 Tax=Olea europaea subsp. europaea TaxID=158383 RepID=A0A8S0P9H1_OLEEU|nr:Hypothetical predicted protein [Olea europaea subsp. europaea]